MSVVRPLVDTERREWFALAVLAMVTGRFPLRIPGTNAWFSISDTFFITSALMFGPAPATVTMAIDSLVMSYVANLKATSNNTRMRRLLFNGSAPALAFWCGAAGVFLAVAASARCSARRRQRRPCWCVPLACFAAVYFVLELRTDGDGGCARRSSQSAVAVWRSHFMTLSLNYFASASARVPADPARAVREPDRRWPR